jgi:4-hydroxybutyrate dehydrogenase/sulfolactaldehyde 3-reductase
LENGGINASSPSEAAEDCEFLFTMLPNSQHVKEAIFEKNGAIESLKKGSIVIDMSTIHPFETDEIREKLNNHGVSMIDCPIGRTSVEARLGKSLLMVGGEQSDIKKATPILNLIGDTLKDCGGPGMGSRMKIVNNYMTTVLNILSGEALTLARSVGLDQKKCIDVLSGTAAVKSHLTTTYPTKVLKNDVSPAFMVELALKDLRIAVNLGDKVNVPLELGKASFSTYESAIEEGRGKQDWTSVFLNLQNRAGLSLPENIKE